MFNFKKEQKKQNDIFDILPSDYLFLQQTLQDMLPFDDIQDDMICLPSKEYRMVVEVSSMNYYLKTYQEQETIEAMFKSALQSWDFPFSFYTQTRSLNTEEIEAFLKKDVEKCTVKQLQSYGREYIREMSQMNKGKNGTLIKKNYIIVECNDAGLISSNYTEEDSRNYAYDKLIMNVRKVAEGLAPMGLACRQLKNEELVELIFIAINKHGAFSMEDLLSHMSNTVFPEVEWNQASVSQIFEGFKNQLIKLLNNSHNLSGTEIERAQAILQRVDELKKAEVDASDEYFDL